MPIGPWELVILILLIVLIFGARRLPEIGRGLGKGMREFKEAITGKDERREQPKPPAELRASAVEEDEPLGAASDRERDRTA